MDYNNPPPVAPQPYYAQQQAGGQVHQPPSMNMAPPQYGQQHGQQMQVIVTRTSPAAMIEYIARGLAILMALLASVIIGTSGDYYRKFSDYSAFLYFLAANILVLIYSIASLVMSIVVKSKPSILRLSNTIVDVVAIVLLSTANGAASATIYVRCWTKLCSQVKASIAMSMLAVGLYLALIVFSLVKSNKKN